MNRLKAVGPMALALALAGCASPTGPTVQRVCIQQSVGSPDENAFVARKAAEYLRQYGFSIAESSCEVTAKFSVFGGFQGEVVARGIIGAFQAGRSGYWSIEGILTVSRDGLSVLEDEPIDLRGYASKQELYAGLAWEIVKPITKKFRPVASK